MESGHDLQEAIKLILQISPSTLAACFIVAFLACLVTQTLSNQDEKKTSKGLPAKQVAVGTVLIITTHIGQAALIVTGIFTSQGPLATTDRNVHSLAQVLVWTVTLVAFLNASDSRLLPFGGFWIGELIVDIALFALTLEYHVPKIPLEWAQYGLALVRIVIILFLLSVLVQRLARGSHERGSDEEAAPLLVDGGVDAEETHTNGVATSYGSTGTSGEARKPGADADDADEEEEHHDEDEDDKKEREDLEKMRNTIKEKGGWFNYAKEFTIFAGLIWPTNKPALQLNMVAIGFILLAIRVLNVLVPRQLGIVVNSLGSADKGRPFRELAIYLVYNFLDSSAGLHTIRQFLWIPVDLNANQNIKTQSFNHIMSLSSDFHDNKRSGELYQSMHQGTSVVDLLETIVFEFSPMVVDLVVACAYFYHLFDAYMLLIVTTTMVSYFWATSYLTFQQTEVRRKYVSASRKSYQVLYDTMDGWKTVSYFNNLIHAQKRYAGGIDRETKSKMSYWLLSYFTTAVQSFALDLGLYSACFYAVYQIMFDGSSVGSFVILLTYWGQLSGPLGYLSRIYRNTVSELIDAEQLLQLLQTKVSIADGPSELKYTNGQVDFHNVDFSYDENKDIIKDLSFHVSPGQTVALVGKTGSGKSTILKLLFRFYDVKGGSISIDGQDIRDVSVTSLRDLMGVVPQDSTMFNETVMANVRYAKLAATDDEVMAACRSAAIHDEILDFPQGYASRVGERGVKLSGGQLQRIAIARAVLKDPAIILLDEATSAVDTETEGKIQAALEKLAKNRTTFVVAHRLSTVNNADWILVIDKGRIAEQGSPAALMTSKGKYYSLWMKQLGLQTGEGNDGDEAGLKEEEEDARLIDIDPEPKANGDAPKGDGEHAAPGSN